ncbi:MAG: hypothetical protein ACI883_000541 [Candidatus Azotimanducaceae bacterium]|jgi:hypothetical protein
MSEPLASLKPRRGVIVEARDYTPVAYLKVRSATKAIQATNP